MHDYTDEERQAVNRWRGVRDSVLRELNALDSRAIEAGSCRFVSERGLNIKTRDKVIAARARLGIDEWVRLQR